MEALVVLVREELQAAMQGSLSTALVVTPLLDEKQIGPSSIDLRLGTEFLISKRYSGERVDPFEVETMLGHEETISVPFGQPFVLHPQEFVLGATFEYLKLPHNLSGQVLGRSSWGRLGLVVATAVVVQAGFMGCLTLELTNEGNVPIVLRPGLRVAQLCLWRSNQSVAVGYSSNAKYKAPLGPQSSRVGVELDELERLQRLAAGLSGTLPPSSNPLPN